MKALAIKRLLPLSALVALSACAVGPDYRKPAPPPPAQTGLSETAANPAVTVEALPPHWWRLFQDPVLDRLVEKALANNNDIRVAAANLKKARALLSVARADRLPTTGITASAKDTRQTINQGQGIQAFETPIYTAGFDASYELDLFGRVSRSIEAGKGDRDVAQAGLDAARVTVAAETARTYASACGFAAQALAARDNAALQQRTLDLTQRLFAGGRSNRADVDQAVVLVEQARSNAANAEAEQRAALAALAVLTGEPPANGDSDANACVTPPALVAPLPVGDGQALLARRPDVRQAERQLASDTARVGVATAALYPTITFAGAISLGATDISDLGNKNGLTYNFGPLLSFNFPFNNAARARVRQNKAIAEGSLASFDQAVLTALQETEQALARLRGALESEQSLSRAYDASASASNIADLRYRNGADSFLTLLDAQRSRAAARLALASAQSTRAQAQVALFKALGGGWEDAPAPTPVPDRSGNKVD